MPEATATARLAGRRLRPLDVWLPLALVVLDQATKALVRARIPLFDSVTVLPVLNLAHVRNTGAAFGMLSDVDFPGKTVLLALIAAVAIVAMAFSLGWLATTRLLTRVGLGLIIGGAAGNLIDRIWLGSVVDFVDVHWGTVHFWAFNVADASITLGVAALILDMMATHDDASDPA